MSHPIPIIEVGLLDNERQMAPFVLTFYGIPRAEFLKVPAPAALHEAMKKRGLVGHYWPSIFLVSERFIHPPAPRRR